MTEYEVVIPLCFLSGVVIVVNLGCIVVISSTPCLRRPSNVALASLLCAHLLQGAVVIPSYAIKRHGLGNRHDQGVVCDLFRFTYMVMNYINCLTLLIISVDRYISIKCPLKYSAYVTKSRIFKVILLAWLYVILLCVIPFMNTHPPNSEGCHYRITKEWTVAMLLGNTLLPCFVISVIYIFIFNKARHVARRKLHFAQPRQDVMLGKKHSMISKRSLREIVAAKMSLLIVLVFFVCWGPSTVYYLLRTLCSTCFNESFDGSNMESLWNLMMKLLTFIDALAAPIIYCWLNRGFRSQLHKLWQKKVLWRRSKYDCQEGMMSRSRSRTASRVTEVEMSRVRLNSMAS